jgi:phosphoglycolate phosphatase-like HAD superfamily hydrolase
MKVLAIDYDGVIVDSVMDSLFVSHNAYLKVYGSKKKKNFGGELFTFKNWPSIKEKYKKEIEYYRSLRPYIRGATDYGLIQKIMEEGTHIKNQQEFDEYRKTVEFNFQKFHDAFYQARRDAQQESFEGWLSLSPPYKEFIKGIRKFVQEGVKVMVATSNRREYIARAFFPDYYDIPVDIDDMLDFSFGEDKSSQIHYICDKYNVNYSDIYFVDDQLAHLEQTRKLGIRVFLAGWSYATEQQKKIARDKKIPVIEREEDFYLTIKKHLHTSLSPGGGRMRGRK